MISDFPLNNAHRGSDLHFTIEKDKDFENVDVFFNANHTLQHWHVKPSVDWLMLRQISAFNLWGVRIPHSTLFPKVEMVESGLSAPFCL